MLCSFELWTGRNCKEMRIAYFEVLPQYLLDGIEKTGEKPVSLGVRHVTDMLIR